MINFDEILLELSYRVEGGIVDLTNKTQLSVLEDILRENGVINIKELIERARVYYSYLNEAANYKAVSKESGKIVQFTSKDNYQDALKSGTHFDVNSKKGKEALKTGGEEKPEPSKSKGASVFGTDGGGKVFPDKKARVIGGKDKTLKKINTLQSKEYQQPQKPNDAEFKKKNKKYEIGPPPPSYKFPNEIAKSAKVAPRHIKALERMMNTKFSQETAKWSHFSDLPGGAGQISAQAGELMTLIGTTLDDKQAEAFYQSLLQHEAKQLEKNPKLQSEGSRVVTKSWIQAAQNNRKAIRNRINNEYPGATITAGAWDTQGEVEAMGLSDYKKNKGFSTDAYFKIKTKDGEEILDEVSLKKSTTVNFLNSGTGKLAEWDSNIPDNINPTVYQNKERKMLETFGTKNVKALEKAALKDKELQSILKSKKMTLKDALQKMKEGKASRDVNKVIMASIQSAANQGDKASKQYLELVQKIHKKHQKDVISALGSNKKLKQGMLNAIKEEFPLKAVGEGEESMAIGPNSLDRSVLKEIFKTSDFDKIKEGLVAMTNEEPPYLAYRAKSGGAVIPIATIGVREDGVGYGGQIKFEMQLDRRFAKILKAANKKIYS